MLVIVSYEILCPEKALTVFQATEPSSEPCGAWKFLASELIFKSGPVKMLSVKRSVRILSNQKQTRFSSFKSSIFLPTEVHAQLQETVRDFTTKFIKPQVHA